MTPEQKLGLAIEAIRDQLVAVIECHEREEHGGEICGSERFNAIAYLAHCLSMNSSRETAKEIRRRLREYERSCAEYRKELEQRENDGYPDEGDYDDDDDSA